MPRNSRSASVKNLRYNQLKFNIQQGVITMKKTFSRFQIAYIHVILLLLIMLSGWCVYITSLMLSV